VEPISSLSSEANEWRKLYMPKTETDTEKLQRRNRELVILNAIAEALNRPVDLDHSLRVALAQVAELLGLDTGWIFLIDEESSTPYLAATQNLPPALAADHTHLQGSCYCLDTYRAGDLRGAANVNVVRCSRLKWLSDGTEGLRYHSSIPLYASGKKLGVLNVASTDWRELSPDDLRLLYTVGDLLSIAIERSQLFARSAQLGAVEERNRLAELAPPPPVPKTRSELEEWTDELEKENAHEEQARKKLEEERRQLLEDQEALETQMREMEVAMARERALIARQETELRRLNTEIQHELEMMQRGDASLREQMAKFQRRAQEVLAKPPGRR